MYDQCIFDNYNIKRPDYDYFARVHVVDNIPGNMPAPPEKPQFEDPTVYLPEDVEKPPAKYGSRWLFMW